MGVDGDIMTSSGFMQMSNLTYQFRSKSLAKLQFSWQDLLIIGIRRFNRIIDANKRSNYDKTIFFYPNNSQTKCVFLRPIAFRFIKTQYLYIVYIIQYTHTRTYYMYIHVCTMRIHLNISRCAIVSNSIRGAGTGR